jgi:hypothetical protein
LPTLGEAIDEMFPKTGSASSQVEQENKGDGMTAEKFVEITKNIRGTDMAGNPYVDRPNPFDRDGLRTERVTLEITHYLPESAAGLEWKYHVRPGAMFESVRVVTDEERDAEVAKLRAEVEELAAEREKFRREWELRTHQLITCGVAADHPDQALSRRKSDYGGPWNTDQAERVRTLREDRDTLKARVAEMEAASGSNLQAPLDGSQAASGGGEQASQLSPALQRIAAAFCCVADDEDDLVEAARCLVRERDTALQSASSRGEGDANG